MVLIRELRRDISITSEIKLKSLINIFIDNTISFFPLQSHANIYEADAVNMDWESLLGRKDISYIFGNPPFKGARDQSDEQKTSFTKTF